MLSFLNNLRNTQLGDLAHSRVPQLADSLGVSQYLPTNSLGSFGAIVFVASISKMRTFDDYSRNTANRTASHEIIGQKPILEFLGPDAEELSITMTFNAALGVNPKEEADAIRKLCQEGTAEYFIINGKPIGDSKWLIVSCSEAVKTWDNRGHIISATVNVSFKESPDISRSVISSTTIGGTR